MVVGGRPGQFTIDVQFDKPLEVLALCIVSDGDHTKSKFQVTVRDIQLNPELKKKLTSIDAQIIESNEQRW